MVGYVRVNLRVWGQGCGFPHSSQAIACMSQQLAIHVWKVCLVRCFFTPPTHSNVFGVWWA